MQMSRSLARRSSAPRVCALALVGAVVVGCGGEFSSSGSTAATASSTSTGGSGQGTTTGHGGGVTSTGAGGSGGGVTSTSGSGGGVTSTSGSGGAGGATTIGAGGAGGGPVDCAAQRSIVDDLLAKARACLLAEAGACQVVVDGPCCPVAVASANASVTGDYLLALEAFKGASCDPKCPMAPCKQPTKVCAPDVNGGASCL